MLKFPYGLEIKFLIISEILVKHSDGDKIYPNKHALQFEEKMKKSAIYVDHLTSDNILDEEPGSF